MKKLKYSGTYNVKPGDFLVYTDNGKSVITERELRHRKLVKTITWTRIRTQYMWDEPKNIGGKLMFKIVNSVENENEFYIFDADTYCYLHSNGIALSTREYFPVKKMAQKVLDKYYPKPKHMWKHGDVFRSGFSHHLLMIYFEILNKQPIAFCLESPICGPTTGIHGDLADATFLFNIKEKI